MSARAPRPAWMAHACLACGRRSWLLAEMSGPLDFCARDRGRLTETLALDDDELLLALGGRRKAQLRARHGQFCVGELRLDPPGVEAVCRHDPQYPPTLCDAGGPRMLYVLGGVRRLEQVAARPVVAIVGTRRPSDYGSEVARSLARGLAAAGLTVASCLDDGIALAAQAGALEVDGATVAVTGGGLGVSRPARTRSLRSRVARRGCVISEVPCDRPGRMWGAAASERIVARLSCLTVVVEAAAVQSELSAARVAGALGRPLAAVPGRVTSHLSAGSNGLLAEGARVVRGAQDVLDLLHPTAAPRLLGEDTGPRSDLAPRLRTMLEDVGSGCDTPEALAAKGASLEDVLLALSELELMGLLSRGDGGRYIPCGARGPL